MKHVVLTRSAYGPPWGIESNRRRLAMTAGVTARSLASQTSRSFEWIVLLHPADPLLEERRAVFAGARFIYLNEAVTGSPSGIAWQAYRADWAGAIGSRDETVCMTRLDDDDAFAPWAMASVERVAARCKQRSVLMLPMGLRVFQGCYTVVRHNSNAMQSLVTMPGDAMTVYDYGHRDARLVAPIIPVDQRPAWIWSRHVDTISGWRFTDQPILPKIRGLFDVDWDLFGEPIRQPRRPTASSGRHFR